MPPALSDLTKTTFLVVGTLFPIVKTIGSAPIFLSLTKGLSSHGRAALARMIAVNGLFLILTSIFIGTHILAFFGISLPVVQVGGGLVVISTGWALLRRPDDSESGGKDEQRACNESDYSRPGLFYPLTLPLTVGPGSISVAITVEANRLEGVGMALDSDRRDVVGVALNRSFDLFELSIRRRYRPHAWRFGNERDYPIVVVHSGVHRRADLVERLKAPCCGRLFDKVAHSAH